MEKLTCIAIDDDPMSLKIVESFIDKTAFLEKKGIFESAIDAATFLQDKKVDLMLLDVEMPQMSGMEFIETLTDPPQIILITSKEKYAVQAFDHHVTDYIVKPVDYPRFSKAAQRAVEAFKVRQSPDIEAKTDSLFIKVSSRLIGIKIREIDYIEAMADYVNIHLNEKRYTVYSTMKGIEQKLPSGEFMRVHRSFIVNVDKIESIEDNTIVVGKKLIPVGVTYRERLLNRLNLL